MEPTNSEKKANNYCQACLIGALLVADIISLILWGIFKNINIFIFLFPIITYVLWRILVKRKYGSDAFKED